MTDPHPLPLPEPNYFGDCPRCGRNDGYLNDGREHWFVCYRHRLKWYAGSNLFSSWRTETPAEVMRQQAQLASYREVRPRDRDPLAAPRGAPARVVPLRGDG